MRISVHVEARVDERVIKDNQGKKNEKQPVVTRIVTFPSDVDVKHDHHPQTATRGTQPHPKCVDLRIRIIKIATHETFEILCG
jgi:hypothetical protein